MDIEMMQRVKKLTAEVELLKMRVAALEERKKPGPKPKAKNEQVQHS